MKLSKLSFVLILLVLGLALSAPRLNAQQTQNLEPQKSNPALNTPAPSSGIARQPIQEKSAYSQDNPSTDQRDTENVPFVIKGIPTEKTAEQAAEDRKERQIKTALDQELNFYTGGQAIFTAVLVIVGIFQLFLFRWQLLMIKESLADTKAAAEAATVGAAATRDSANTAKLSMVDSERAYVHFDGCRWVSHPHTNDGHIFWRIRTKWINSGDTPTRGLRMYAHFDLRDNELSLDYAFTQDQTKKPIPITLRPHGTLESGGWDINGTDLVAISKREKHLYIWGRAVYRDVFPGTDEHITKFCVVATNLTGDPLKAWHDTDNPFDIAFALYSKHNCADEDCSDQE